MKKFLLFSLILCVSLIGYAQKKASITQSQKEKVVKLQYQQPIGDLGSLSNPYNPTVSNMKYYTEEEAQIGTTWYDLMTNGALANRVVSWEDGSVAAVWTMGFTATAFPERGTGYNYFDGSAWGPAPTVRLESARSGFPSMCDYGANGELVVSHSGLAASNSLIFNYRATKGTGAWTEFYKTGPSPDWLELLWPRIVTSGENNDIIQMIVPTTPTGNGGIVYNGMDPALLYSRSTDGGATWDPDNIQLDGTTIDNYLMISAEVYTWAEPVGNTIAFIVSDTWNNDMFVMKSNDNGDSWTKTVVWEHPYPFFNWDVAMTDTMWAPDGSHDIAIDQTGKVHAVTSICRVLFTEPGGTSYNYWPYGEGIAYWNEDMPVFEDPNGNPHDALNVWDGVLIEDVNLVGWSPDVDGDGVLTLLDEILVYRTIGLSTMPNVTVDKFGDVFVVYASTTETYDNTVNNFKHIWFRQFDTDANAWGDLEDMTDDLIHIFDECIYPTAADKTGDNKYHFIYMADATPGVALDDTHPYQENRMTYHNVKPFFTGENENISNGLEVMIKNPISDFSVVRATTSERAALSLEVYNMTGQKVFEMNKGYVNAGNHDLRFDASSLKAGMYFYTVKSGSNTVTQKVVVQ